MHWYEFDEVEVIQAMYRFGQDYEREECDVRAIRSLIKTMNLTAQQAMDVLEIPAEQQKKYLRLI